jgi:E3 ubiquitin-protein ligase ATL10/75/76/77/78
VEDPQAGKSLSLPPYIQSNLKDKANPQSHTLRAKTLTILFSIIINFNFNNNINSFIPIKLKSKFNPLFIFFPPIYITPPHCSHLQQSVIFTQTNMSTRLVADFYSRRLLLHNPLHHSPAGASPPATGIIHDSEAYSGDNNFDANVVMVLSVLLCALICSLGMNSIIRCALRCSNLVVSDSGNSTSTGGAANTGVKKKALKTFPTVNYSPDHNLPGLDAECVICLSDFAPGDRLRLLPKCHHGFHVRCIDKWLSSHSSCPKCRNCLIETCQKIVGSSSGLPPPPPPPMQESTVSIAPLEPEGFIHNYRGT